MQNKYFVIDRHGEISVFDYNKIHYRLTQLSNDLNINIDEILFEFIKKHKSSLTDKEHTLSTSKIDEYITDISNDLFYISNDYTILAARLANSNIEKSLPSEFSRNMAICYTYNWAYSNYKYNIPNPDDYKQPEESLISYNAYKFIYKHAEVLDDICQHDKCNLTYNGIKTLYNKYLLRLYTENASTFTLVHHDNNMPIPATITDMTVEIPPPMKFNSSCLSDIGKHSKVIETPADLYMRLAVHLCMDECDCDSDDESSIEECSSLKNVELLYNLMYLDNKLTFATPALLNSCNKRNSNMISCFLLSMPNDSIDGIYTLLSQCAEIAKNGGGIGFSCSNIRATGSYIRGTNSISNGLTPLLNTFNSSSNYVNQGGNKRPGSMSAYLSMWHADLPNILTLMHPHERNPRTTINDLFYGLWINDLFMERMILDQSWTLMSEDTSPRLMEVYGGEFRKLYKQYELEDRGRMTISAKKLWNEIAAIKLSSGLPYICFGDNANSCNSQKHLGTLKSSNLCTEIYEYHSKDEIACCTLSSISLDVFVITNTDSLSGNVINRQYDFKSLMNLVRVSIRYLDKVIDVSSYPLELARKSNNAHRPLSLGVRGLADVFIQMRMPYCSEEAKILTSQIFESIYFAALTESCAIAQEKGAYSTFSNSPASRGILHQDMWLDRVGELKNIAHNITNLSKLNFNIKDVNKSIIDYSKYTIDLTSPLYSNELKLDWTKLRTDIAKYGLRNSLMIGLMPTESTSIIAGGSKSFEPIAGVIYNKQSGNGEFRMTNKHAIQLLTEYGIWNSETINYIISHNGSIQGMPNLDPKVAEILLCMNEISQMKYIKLCARIQPWVDQGLSLNITLPDSDPSKFTTLMIMAWLHGLKTGCYYLKCTLTAHAGKLSTIDNRVMDLKPECFGCAL